MSLLRLLKKSLRKRCVTVVAAWPAAGWDAGVVVDEMLPQISNTEIGQQKINVIKVVKELLWLWLKEAKNLVEKHLLS